MSHYCMSHPRYSAKREPKSRCGNCWQLWHYRCPEVRHDYKRIFTDMIDDVTERWIRQDQKNLVSEASKPPRRG